MALTVIAFVGVAVFILLFEKKRADRIQRDLQGPVQGDEPRRTPGSHRKD